MSNRSLEALSTFPMSVGSNNIISGRICIKNKLILLHNYLNIIHVLNVIPCQEDRALQSLVFASWIDKDLLPNYQDLVLQNL